MLVLAALLDALVRPRTGRPWRSLPGLWLLGWSITAQFGLFLALSGHVATAAVLALAFPALLVLVSNAKHAMLGEPLHFSDLALIGAVFSHPQFYLSAIRVWQRIVAGAIFVALLGVLAWLFVPALPPHLAGVALAVVSVTVLALSLRSRAFRALAERPDAPADLRRHGLIPVLLLYWRSWRRSADPAPCPAPLRESPTQPQPELLVVIQGESFADPQDLFPAGQPLPGLTAARAQAWQWGQLAVSGFGAYTMRTEYGVLFGRSEEALGFRSYDPFLTALGEASYALPARLAPSGWRSLFVHPHDMRFYGRDAIMPAAGFAQLVAEDRFAPPTPEEGRYVTDAAIADELVALAQAATGPMMLYAVTIENHGPWAPEETGGHHDKDLKRSYLRLLGNSDAMLSSLIARIGALQRPALLVFFGDHRPSIPGATQPHGDRHTPYVMMRFDEKGQPMRGENRRIDLTPSQLHHAMLNLTLGDPLP
ncbi:LTA synthase family protein [Novosphingobium rosa]|uniref:LTA synthase family protein n=1 Tax=Novosphingobium rosa TaxID=76978 RepID=UPI000B159B85|nr:LTA synthase family protein [Novosphingobium rosa]